MLDNLLINSSFNKVNPYTKVDTANGMPIESPRRVEPVNYGSRSKEFVERQNFKGIFSRDLSPSSGSLTESFIKSRFMLSPYFSQNESKTRYEMISKLENKISQIRKNVELFA